MNWYSDGRVICCDLIFCLGGLMCAEKQLAHDYTSEITGVEHYDVLSVGKSELDSFT